MTQVFALAAFASLDAGLLTAAVALLGRPRPARQLLAYLVGGMGLSIGFGLVIVLALHGSKLQLGRTTQAMVELAAGALLILVALAAAFGREIRWHPRRTRQADTARPQRQSLYDRAIGHDSLWIAWAAGALYSVPGAEYLAGLALLTKVNAPAPTEILVVLAFNVIMFALIELPLLGFVAAPNRTRSLTESLNRWMTAHRRILVAIVAGAIGVYLLVSGLGDLG